MGFDWGVIPRNIGLLWGGLTVTFKLFFLALAGGLPLGILLGLGSLSSRRWLYYPTRAYINFMRNIPLILVIFWVYFVMPLVTGRALGPFTSAVLAFVIFEATYFGEIIRAGFQSVSKGQVQSAYSTGLTYFQMVRYILIPIAIRRVIPSLITQSIVIFQDTSLAFVIGLREFIRAARIVDMREVRTFELFSFVALVYFVLCLAGSFITRRLEVKQSER
ncbi:MAG: amino acid ABC transporter permease [Candidatus Bipolaricaulia bacterium]